MQKEERKYGFWNWGTGLAIAIALGCLGIIFLVYTASTYEFQMVESDYYERETEFNDKVIAIQNANTLSDSIIIIDQEPYLLLKLPKEVIGKHIEGSIQFYCPVNASQDFVMPLRISEENYVAVAKEKLQATTYQIIADFKMDNKSYHIQQEYLNK